MYFKAIGRTNPQTNNYEGYYRLVESYRNTAGRKCYRTILNIGFLVEPCRLQLKPWYTFQL